jgi:hypothetical protein
MVFEINAYTINKNALYDLNNNEIITNGKTILYELFDTETNKEIGSLQFKTYLTEYGGGNDTYLIFDSIYYFSNIVQETKELGSGTMNAKYSDKLQDAELKLKTTGVQLDSFGFQGSLRYLGKECIVSLKNDNQGKIFYNFKFN